MNSSEHQSNRRPWDRQPDHAAGSGPGKLSPTATPKLPFEGLDSILVLLMVLAIIAGVFAVIAAFAGDSVGLIFAGTFFGAAITCALGRVLIFIAQRVDHIAKLSEIGLP